MRARPNASRGTWRPAGNSTTLYSQRGNDDCDTCELIRLGKRHVRCLALASKSERRPFARCGSSMASANTVCTGLPKGPGKPGSRSILMRCWPKPWPHARIRPSTACAWARRAVCASRVAGAGSTASRTSATIPAYVSYCTNQNKAMTAT